MAAAKAQIRRYTAPHKRRREFEAPEHVKQAWANTKDRTWLAEVLRDCNFNKAGQAGWPRSDIIYIYTPFLPTYSLICDLVCMHAGDLLFPR